MQPTDLQVQKSLLALEQGRSTTRGSAVDELVPAPAGIVEMLSVVPALRLERVVDARMRLAAGMQPTDDDLASRMVSRLVCDRLR